MLSALKVIPEPDWTHYAFNSLSSFVAATIVTEDHEF